MPAAAKRKPRTARRPPRNAEKSARTRALGALPEWNLTDLYPSHDSPQMQRDLQRADAECVAFEEAYKGKLAGLADAADAGPKLAQAVKAYEALSDLLGRL